MIPCIATILPLEARSALVRASQVEPEVPAGDSVLRAYVIDSVLGEIRAKYPELFQAED